MSLPIKLGIIRDSATRAESGFLRSLPLLFTQYGVNDFSYHWERWYRQSFHPNGSENSLMPHRFVHTNALNTQGVTSQETGQPGTGIGFVWHRNSLNWTWDGRPFALGDTLSAAVNAGFTKAYLVIDDPDGMHLWPMDYRPLSEYVEPLEFDDLYTSFCKQIRGAGFHLLAMASRSYLLEGLCVWEQACGRRCTSLADLTRPDSVLPRLVLSRLCGGPVVPEKLVDVDYLRLRRQLEPFVDNKRELTLLAEDCWAIRDQCLEEYWIEPFALTSDQYSAVHHIQVPAVRKLVEHLAFSGSLGSGA